MKTFKFDSKIEERGKFFCDFDKKQIADEPMFYRANAAFAYENGGIITKAFLENLPEDWRNCDVTIDSRSHMLMPGWYPCIPGFHHDDVPRTRIDGQPNYENPGEAEHLMGLVNGHICPTEFAVGQVELEEVPIGQLVYRQWHKDVERAISDGVLFSETAKSGRYIQFDNFSFHQGVGAVRSGWRWFIRVSRKTDRAKDCKNEIRKQTQVYMKDPMQGW